MADQLEKRTRKDSGESEDDSMQKRQKKHEHDEHDDATQAKTITNIYYDCLERIFDFLDIESLLNVAGTCKRLQIAAAAKFGDEYGETAVRISLYNSRERVSYIHENQVHQIFDGKLKFCFPFLRCFGAKISNLALENLCKNDNLDSYVNEYCADTLKSISYRYSSGFSSQAFQKPFKHVENVGFMMYNLENQLPKFVNWFPNLQRLSISDCWADASTIAVSFPHLEHLSFSFGHIDMQFLPIGNAKNLLQANRQLQSLEFKGDIDLKFSSLLDMIDENASISKLVVLESWDITLKDVTMTELNRFAAEHPFVVELILKSYRFAVDDVVSFIGQLNALKCFKFLVNGRSEVDRLLNQLDQLNQGWQHQIEESLDGDFEITLKRQ